MMIALGCQISILAWEQIADGCPLLIATFVLKKPIEILGNWSQAHSLIEKKNQPIGTTLLAHSLPIMIAPNDDLLIFA